MALSQGHPRACDTMLLALYLVGKLPVLVQLLPSPRRPLAVRTEGDEWTRASLFGVANIRVSAERPTGG